MNITYKNRSYELTYFGKLIEKRTPLREHIDFEFGACNQDETTINYLRDMTKDELSSIQTLIDIPIQNDNDIKQIILKNISQGLSNEFQATVQSIGQDGIVNVSYLMKDIFDEKAKIPINCFLPCKTTIQGISPNDIVIVKYIDNDFVIMGKIL